MAGRSKFEVVGKKSVLLHQSQEKLKFKLWRLPISRPVELEKTYVPLLKGLSSGKTDLKQKMGISFTEKEPRSIIERCYGGYKVLYLILKNDRFQRVQK